MLSTNNPVASTKKWNEIRYMDQTGRKKAMLYTGNIIAKVAYVTKLTSHPLEPRSEFR